MKKIILISIAAHIVLGLALAPWLKTRMLFDEAREAERTEEVKKRELARQEYERLKREKQKLDAETARKLRKEAERRKKREIAKEVERLRKLRDEIMEHQRQKLAQLRQRKLEDILETEQLTFVKQAKKIHKHTSDFTGIAGRRNFSAACFSNGHGRGSLGLIDEIVVYKETLTPPFDSKPAHRFTFDDTLADTVTGREGKFKNGGKFSKSQFLLCDGNNARVEFWPMEFGDNFTITARIKLDKKNNDTSQAIFANSHSGDYNRGFRFYADPGNKTTTFLTLGTSGKEKGREVRSLPDVVTFGRWHEVAISIDKPDASARIFVDGRDVTAPESKIAPDFTSNGLTIDGSTQKMTREFIEQIEKNTPTPESVTEIKEDLEALQERFDQRMEETPDDHAVRNEINNADKDAEAMKESLDALEAKTDLKMMNDTSTSLADKMSPDADATTPAELYNQASELENQIAEAAADINAVNEAGQENTSFAEARLNNAATTPNRPDIASELSSQRTPETVGDLNEFRQSLDRAANEVSDMAARAEGVLGAAENRSGNSAQRPGNAFATQRSRFEAATGDHGFGAVIDMTGFGQGQGEDKLTSDMRRDQSAEGANMKFGSKIASLRLDEHAIMPKALPGRRFTKNSPRKGWLYLDTWYVVGPWENHSKVDFELSHPPEDGIDFDAVYHDGKFADKLNHPDQTLKWEFYQSDSVRCQPPRVYGASTYYAHTEVWFEQARDMLIAVASDDAASLWLNEQIIWQDTGQSVWRLGEGYRRVHFKKGYNTLLVRIENGPTKCVWSVLLCPPEAMEKK
ncbi:hypothetical protein OAE72_00190 [Akkermansiaceae bacterium]|nr:hypothetical protein [Akkermansiaceae bacterium]